MCVRVEVMEEGVDGVGALSFGLVRRRNGRNVGYQLVAATIGFCMRALAPCIFWGFGTMREV